MPAKTKSERAAQRRPINERALLTTRDACAYLSIGRDRLRQFRDSGDVSAILLSATDLRWRRADLDSLADKLAAGETLLQRMTGGKR